MESRATDSGSAKRNVASAMELAMMRNSLDRATMWASA